MIVNNIRTITAIERNEFNIRTLTITCKILKPCPDFNLQKAIRQSIHQYLCTPDGRNIYICNGEYFNWKDFATHVPNEINRLYGFETVKSTLNNIVVDYDEQLANETDLQKFWGDNLDTDEE